MDRISNLIPRVLSKKGLKDQASASYATFLATEWIAQHMLSVAKQLHPKKLADGVLWVESDHSIASQELMQNKNTLLRHLNECEGISVSDVRIVLSSGSN